jgi:hypothetical protein
MRIEWVSMAFIVVLMGFTLLADPALSVGENNATTNAWEN